MSTKKGTRLAKGQAPPAATKVSSTQRQKKAAPTKAKDGKKKKANEDDEEEQQQVAKPKTRARTQPKRLEKEEEGEKEEEEEDDEQAVPKTPQIERAKAICMSAKRHLARPLDETAAVDLTVVPQTPRISKLRGSEVVAKSDYDELLERFNQLKGLRTTKAEKMYQKHLATTEAREKATAKFIENLKIENKRLHEQLTSSAAKQEKKDRESKNKRVEEEAKHQQANKQQLERANATLQFLRQLTRIDTKPHPEEGATAFSCSCKNPNDKRALAFVLTMTEDAMEYKPIKIIRLPPLPSSGKQPNWEINEMFVEEIYFSPQFAPIFLSKLLATVYGTKKAAK